MVKPGGFVLVPKGVQHFASASEETVIQLHGVGPQSITYGNPADDRGKSKKKRALRYAHRRRYGTHTAKSPHFLSRARLRGSARVLV